MIRRTDLGALTHGGADWAGLRVLVTGLGISGFAAADALAERGAQVVLVDAAEPSAGTDPSTIVTCAPRSANASAAAKPLTPKPATSTRRPAHSASRCVRPLRSRPAVT